MFCMEREDLSNDTGVSLCRFSLTSLDRDEVFNFYGFLKNEL